jgi:hypothetical protein
MHMLHRRRRLVARFLAISLLAATLFTVDSLTSPDTAEARCKGQGNPFWSYFSYNGAIRVSENPYDGTCNGNNIYTGLLKDESSDGLCVSVKFKEAGFDWMIPDGGTVCGYGGTSRFEWRDINGNSLVYQQFCLANPNTGFAVCGWGNQVGNQYSAQNWGY